MNRTIIYVFFIFLSYIFLSNCDQKSQLSPEEQDQERQVVLADSIAKGLIMHLTFDGDGKDSTDPDHLTILNNCTFISDRDGKPDHAIYFDGVSSYVDIISPISKAENYFTLSFWIKNLSLTSQKAYVLMFREESYFDIYMDVDELTCRFKYKKNLAADPVRLVNGLLPTNEWSHIVVRYDKGDLIQLFIDGELRDVYTEPQYGTFSETNSGIRSAIGCYNNPGNESNFWEGSIDDIRLYDRWMSNDEIQYLFKNQ